MIYNTNREYHLFTEADNDNQQGAGGVTRKLNDPNANPNDNTQDTNNADPAADTPSAEPDPAMDDAEDYTMGADDTDYDDDGEDYTPGDGDLDSETGSDPAANGDPSDTNVDVNVDVNTGDGGEEGDTTEDYTDGGDGSDDMGDVGLGDVGEDRDTITGDLNAIEQDIFGDLTDEQKKFKHRELIRLFNKLFDAVEKTIVRINNVPKTDANIRVVKLAAKTLVELKEMIHANIADGSYWTRTYFENDILYQQCLAQYNAVANLLFEIAPKKDENAEEDLQNQLDKASDDTDTSGVNNIELSDTEGMNI